MADDYAEKFPVGAVGDVGGEVEMVLPVGVEPDPSNGHSQANTNAEVNLISDAAVGFQCQGILATTPADYIVVASSMESVAERDMCKENVADYGFSVDGLTCDGCWEQLPFSCGCGSLRFCAECFPGGAVLSQWAEAGKRNTDSRNESLPESAGGEHEGTWMQALHGELQVMVSNIERMGSFGGWFHDEERLVGCAQTAAVGGPMEVVGLLFFCALKFVRF